MPLLWILDKALGLVTDFIKPLLTILVAVYAADYYGVIDVGAFINQLINQFLSSLDPTQLLTVAGVVL
ncbi:hypothetical protein BDK61_1487 [Haloarcula quadrata]|uniref:Uncharacterized protein n=1 Tax=Haloarcula quadrata TaxID=182779 RepID=A0A495R4C9_9EURY|nr:hypothetical protein [Haloarcula quadrata]RKS82187.1 hypothetical protein BDK61_1487 [Haloarcula quadrata]